jgi:predicted membrane protein
MIENNKELRNFGLLVGGIFGLLGLVPHLLFHRNLHVLPLVLGLLLMFLGCFRPGALRSVYKVWMILGSILGWVNTRVILFAFFCFVLTPMAILKKVFGKDSLNRKLDKSKESYRILQDMNREQTMERTF